MYSADMYGILLVYHVYNSLFLQYMCHIDYAPKRIITQLKVKKRQNSQNDKYYIIIMTVSY